MPYPLFHVLAFSIHSVCSCKVFFFFHLFLLGKEHFLCINLSNISYTSWQRWLWIQYLIYLISKKSALNYIFNTLPKAWFKTYLTKSKLKHMGFNSESNRVGLLSWKCQWFSSKTHKSQLKNNNNNNNTSRPGYDLIFGRACCTCSSHTLPAAPCAVLLFSMRFPSQSYPGLVSMLQRWSAFLEPVIVSFLGIFQLVSHIPLHLSTGFFISLQK